MILYRLGVSALETAYRIAGHWKPKAKQWVEGRRELLSKASGMIGRDDRIFWIHAASVGEFEQGRPVIEYVREHHPEFKILLTFYSPSGYELRKNYKGADYILYFPSDKQSIARKFIEIIHPEIAVFVKYEFWLNTLGELRKRNIRTYLISAKFMPESIFFKPIGFDWRNALKSFNTIFVQDKESKELLENIGINKVTVAGDTRFDRVMEISKSAKDLPTVERFSSGKRVFVAGSTWQADEDLLIQLINDNPDIKFIIAPHEMDEARIQRLIDETKGGATRYTCPGENYEGKHVLIIDTIGLLSTIYKYASWVYVGGGFGAGIHNTVEPATYGLPLAFGPKYHRFNEAVKMVELGVAKVITDYETLSIWFRHLKENEEERLQTCKAAREYTNSQLGATTLIVKQIGL